MKHWRCTNDWPINSHLGGLKLQNINSKLPLWFTCLNLNQSPNQKLLNFIWDWFNLILDYAYFCLLLLNKYWVNGLNTYLGLRFLDYVPNNLINSFNNTNPDFTLYMHYNWLRYMYIHTSYYKNHFAIVRNANILELILILLYYLRLITSTKILRLRGKCAYWYKFRDLIISIS